MSAALAWLLTGFVLYFVGVWLVRRYGTRLRLPSLPGLGVLAGPAVWRLRRELRRMTGDPAAADRLVEAERRRHPDASEREVLRRVVRRLRRDKSR